MNKMSIDKAAVIGFAREILGCTCPDSVFEHIEIEENVELDTTINIFKRFNIGNRLLIYLIDADAPRNERILDKLQTIFTLGTSERDRQGFNRFRLVLLTNDFERLSNNAETMLASMHGIDERTHLHFIDRDVRW